MTKDAQSKNQQPNNPLHGLTLEAVVTQLVDSYGFPYLAERVKINCFKSDPSIKSSLKFLRRTLWAREQVEKLYVAKFAKLPPQSIKAKSKPKLKPARAQSASGDTSPESLPKAKPSGATNPWVSGAYQKP
ncbi:VF530 family protein [Porticoccaceae bacterium]|nr:VF530 family protein [Porticoccaceae bacterium]